MFLSGRNISARRNTLAKGVSSFGRFCESPMPDVMQYLDCDRML